MAASNEPKKAKEEPLFKLSALIPIKTNMRLDIFKARNSGLSKQDIVTDAIEYYLDELGVEKV